MTITEFKTLLETTGYPVAYNHFDSKQTFPFICLRVDKTTNFYADSEMYLEINRIAVELYTKTKDFEAEQKIKDAFADYPWECVGEYYINDDTEKYYQINYEMEI